MNRNDIIRLAREAGLPLEWISESGVLTWSELKRFAALVAAAEREACERLAWDTPDDEETGIRTAIALAIRARGEA